MSGGVRSSRVCFERDPADKVGDVDKIWKNQAWRGSENPPGFVKEVAVPNINQKKVKEQKDKDENACFFFLSSGGRDTIREKENEDDYVKEPVADRRV